jgi:NitT/TauT family transport system permease protein
MKIVFLILATFFYFLPSTILILKDVDKRLIETSYTMGLNKFKTILYVILPYSLPMIFLNFMVMYSIGWTYIIVAEMINANQGLGYLINIASARGRTDLVFMAVFTIMLISFLFDKLGNKIIRHVFKWKFKTQMED